MAASRTRTIEAEEGMAFARRWKAAQGPVAYAGGWPIRDHRSMAEVMAGESAQP